MSRPDARLDAIEAILKDVDGEIAEFTRRIEAAGEARRLADAEAEAAMRGLERSQAVRQGLLTSIDALRAPGASATTSPPSVAVLNPFGKLPSQPPVMADGRLVRGVWGIVIPSILEKEGRGLNMAELKERAAQHERLAGVQFSPHGLEMGAYKLVTKGALVRRGAFYYTPSLIEKGAFREEERTVSREGAVSAAIQALPDLKGWLRPIEIIDLLRMNADVAPLLGDKAASVHNGLSRLSARGVLQRHKGMYRLVTQKNESLNFAMAAE